MTNKSRSRLDWSSLWRKEDWLSVWLGFAILAVAAAGIITWIPELRLWTTDVTKAFPAGAEYFVALLFGFLLVSIIGVVAMKEKARSFAVSFPLIFFLSFLSLLIAKQELIGKQYGLEFALWALVLGLVVNTIVGTPKWLQAAAKTELFIKIGLVLLGAEILFNKILGAGVYGMIQALIVVFSVFYFAYWLATRIFKIERRFAAVLASAVSICGVSAAIAAGGAVKGNKKHISYAISVVLLLAVPMLIFMPLIARAIGLPDAVAGAWIGGTIDTTPAVVAAGSLYSKLALEIASIVKISQNVLIGVAAFILALVFATRARGNRKESKPSKLEIWYRFPKFVIGFIAASIVFSVILVPALGPKSVDSIVKITSGLRGWWFAMAFVSIGLTTKIKELVKIGKGKPFIAFIIAQIFNILLVLFIAYAIFGGIASI